MWAVENHCKEICWGNSCQGRSAGNDGYASLCVCVCPHSSFSVLWFGSSVCSYVILPCLSVSCWVPPDVCVCACVCLLALSLTVCQESFLIVVKRWQARVSLIYHSPSTHRHPAVQEHTYTKVVVCVLAGYQLLSDSTLVSEVTELYGSTLLAWKNNILAAFHLFDWFGFFSVRKTMCKEVWTKKGKDGGWIVNKLGSKNGWSKNGQGWREEGEWEKGVKKIGDCIRIQRDEYIVMKRKQRMGEQRNENLQPGRREIGRKLGKKGVENKIRVKIWGQNHDSIRDKERNRKRN